MHHGGRKRPLYFIPWWRCILHLVERWLILFFMNSFRGKRPWKTYPYNRNECQLVNVAEKKFSFFWRNFCSRRDALFWKAGNGGLFHRLSKRTAAREILCSPCWPNVWRKKAAHDCDAPWTVPGMLENCSFWRKGSGNEAYVNHGGLRLFSP